MTEFPDLHQAYPKPSPTEMDAALRQVADDRRSPSGRNRGWTWSWRLAAGLAGVAAAYGVGYFTGARHRAAPQSAPRSEAKIIVRPPVLVAGPKS